METSGLEKLRPTLRSSFDHGWEHGFGKYSGRLIILVLITIGCAILSQFSPLNFDLNDAIQGFKDGWNSYDHPIPVRPSTPFELIPTLVAIFGLAYSIFVLPVISFGSSLIYLNAIRGIRPDFRILLLRFREKYFNVILANLLVGATVIVGFIFLIVPGVILACRLVFVPYLVMDKKLDPIAAMEESIRMTRGRGWTILLMILFSLFILAVSFVLLIVGVIFGILWIESSFASMYQAVLLEEEQKMAAA